MTYYSTGEVRIPEMGEWYLTWSQPGFSHGEHSIVQCACYRLDEPRVIMRPVERTSDSIGEVLEPNNKQENCPHDFEELIDPRSGGWMRCRLCGLAIDCEDPDGDLR